MFQYVFLIVNMFQPIIPPIFQPMMIQYILHYFTKYWLKYWLQCVCQTYFKQYFPWWTQVTRPLMLWSRIDRLHSLQTRVGPSKSLRRWSTALGCGQGAQGYHPLRSSRAMVPLSYMFLMLCFDVITLCWSSIWQSLSETNSTCDVRPASRPGCFHIPFQVKPVSMRSVES